MLPPCISLVIYSTFISPLEQVGTDEDWVAPLPFLSAVPVGPVPHSLTLLLISSQKAVELMTKSQSAP